MFFPEYATFQRKCPTFLNSVARRPPFPSKRHICPSRETHETEFGAACRLAESDTKAPAFGGKRRCVLDWGRLSAVKLKTISSGRAIRNQKIRTPLLRSERNGSKIWRKHFPLFHFSYLPPTARARAGLQFLQPRHSPRPPRKAQRLLHPPPSPTTSFPFSCFQAPSQFHRSPLARTIGVGMTACLPRLSQRCMDSPKAGLQLRNMQHLVTLSLCFPDSKPAASSGAPMEYLRRESRRQRREREKGGDEMAVTSLQTAAACKADLIDRTHLQLPLWPLPPPPPPLLPSHPPPPHSDAPPILSVSP